VTQADGNRRSRLLAGLVLDVLVLPLDNPAVSQVASFGRRVRVLRRKKGWSQEELADRSGLTAVHISRIERGTREVRLTTILRLTAALEARPDELLGDL
jgi:DNA-binding Xre family transcriptional regulator